MSTTGAASAQVVPIASDEARDASKDDVTEVTTVTTVDTEKVKDGESESDLLDELTDEQIAEFKEAFSNFDRNGDGCITTGELGTVMRHLGQDPSEEELKEMIEEVDQDGDGTIDFEEYLIMMVKKMRTHDSEDDLLEAFDTFDPEGTGFISVAQLEHILNSLGEDITREEMLELVAGAEVEGTGRVDYRRFTRTMLELAPG